MKIEVKHFFSAAHKLPDSEYLVTKECARLHGHTYAVKVSIDAAHTRNGMVVDFKAIKNVIDELDHQYINEVWEQAGGVWKNAPTTAENIAQYIRYRVAKVLAFPDAEVSVCEGYKGEGNSSWVHTN